MKRNITLFGIAVGLGIIAAVATYWKSTWCAHLLDYAYVAEISYRFFLGQMPYRDFILVLPPGEFAITALIMRLTGGYSHIWLVIQAMGVAFLTSAVSYMVFLRLSKSQWLSFLLSLCIIPVGQGIFPYPDYGIWASLMVMTCLLCLTWYQKAPIPNWIGLAIGILSASSYLFKQNVGIPFTGLVFFCYGFFGLLGLFGRDKQARKTALFVIVGQGIVLFCFAAWLAWNHVLTQFYYQTVTYAMVIRDPGVSIQHVIEDYQTSLPLLAPIFIGACILGFLLPIIRRLPGQKIRTWILAGITIFSFGIWTYCLIVAYTMIPSNIDLLITLIWVCIMIFGMACFIYGSWLSICKRALNRFLFIPVILLVTLHMGFLTFRIFWSNYPFWPLLYAILAWSYPFLKRIFQRFPIELFVGTGLLISLYAMTGYMTTDEYLHNANLYTEGPIVHSTKGSLAGLSDPGPWIPAFEHLLADTDKRIPKTDTVAFLPGDDVFLAATGRKSVMWCSLWDYVSCDSHGEKLGAEIRDKKIDWIIIKDPTMFPTAYDSAIPQVPLDLSYTLQAEIDEIYKIYKKP